MFYHVYIVLLLVKSFGEIKMFKTVPLKDVHIDCVSNAQSRKPNYATKLQRVVTESKNEVTMRNKLN